MFSYKICFLRVKNPQGMKNLNWLALSAEPYTTSSTVVSSNLILSVLGIIFGNGTAGLTFLYILLQSFNFSILGLTNAVLRVFDRKAWDGHLGTFFPECLRKGRALSLVWLMLYSPLSWYSLFSRFGGTATGVNRLNFLVSGYFIQFPDYHHHMAATTIFSMLACHTRQLEFCVCPFYWTTILTKHRFLLGGPAKCSKVGNTIVGIWTRTHLEIVNKWEHSEPFTILGKDCKVIANCWISGWKVLEVVCCITYGFSIFSQFFILSL